MTWQAYRNALKSLAPGEVPDFPPAGGDPVVIAAAAAGLRAVRVAPTALTSDGAPAIVLDADDQVVVARRREPDDTAADQRAWRLYPRRAGRLRLPIAVLVTSVLAAAISCASSVLALSHWWIAAVAVVPVTALLMIRDRIATEAQHDVQAAVEPVLWNLALDRQDSPDLLVAASLVSHLRSLASAAVLDGLLALAMVCSAFTVLLSVRIEPAFAVLGVTAVVLFAMSRLALRTRAERAEGPGELLDAVLTGIDEIHLYAAERTMLDRVLARSAVASARSEELLAALASALLPLLLAALVLGGAELPVACAVLAQLLVALGRIDGTVRSVFIVGAEAVRSARTMLSGARADRYQVLSLPLRGNVEVRSATLEYDGPALNDVSLCVGEGEFVAVVGPSGAGKSSLLRLLSGLETPHRGEVRHDGTPAGELLPAQLRAQIGYVPQDGGAPRGTVRSVVLGYASTAPDDDAWTALRDAGVDAVVRDLPMGLSTVVQGGTGGFSASQLQLMVVARAFAREPRLLLLDEPPPAVLAGLLLRDKATRVVATHSPLLARAADRVVVLDGGTVVESGHYDELVTAGGALTRLFESTEGES